MVSQAERLKLKVPTPQPRISPTGAAAKPGGLLGPAGVQTPDTRPGGLLGPSSAPPSTSAPRTITVTPNNPLTDAKLNSALGRTSTPNLPTSPSGLNLKTPLASGIITEGSRARNFAAEAAPAPVQPAGPMISTRGLDVGAIANMPLPNYNEREQDVEKLMRPLLERDSAYMQRARMSGMQAGQARGLLNSSLAAGAAEGAAMDKAFDIASQTASQNFQRNLSNQNFRQEASLQIRDIAARFMQTGAELDSQEAVAAARIAADKEMQGIQLDFEEQRYLDEIKAQFGLQANEIAADFGILEKQLASDKELTVLREQGADRRLGVSEAGADRRLGVTEQGADRRFFAGEEAQMDRLLISEAGADRRTTADLEYQQRRDTQRQEFEKGLSDDKIAADKVAQAMDFYTRAEATAAAERNEIKRIDPNKLNDEDRQAMEDAVEERFLLTVSVIPDVFGVDLPWLTPPASGATPTRSAPGTTGAADPAVPAAGVGSDAAATAAALDAGAPPPASYTAAQKNEWRYMQTDPTYVPVLLDLNGRPLTARELAARGRREDGGYDGDGRGNSGPGAPSGGPTGGDSGLGGARGGDDGDGTRG